MNTTPNKSFFLKTSIPKEEKMLCKKTGFSVVIFLKDHVAYLPIETQQQKRKFQNLVSKPKFTSHHSEQCRQSFFPKMNSLHSKLNSHYTLRIWKTSFFVQCYKACRETKDKNLNTFRSILKKNILQAENSRVQMCKENTW